jgi:hypothetical protein
MKQVELGKDIVMVLRVRVENYIFKNKESRRANLRQDTTTAFLKQ